MLLYIYIIKFQENNLNLNRDWNSDLQNSIIKITIDYLNIFQEGPKFEKVWMSSFLYYSDRKRAISLEKIEKNSQQFLKYDPDFQNPQIIDELQDQQPRPNNKRNFETQQLK